MKRIEYCKDKDGFLCYLRAIQGHSGDIPIEPELMGYVFLPRNLKRYVFQKRLSWNYQSILGHGLIPGGKEKDNDRQSVFLTPTNPFGNDPEEEEPHDDFTVPQKVPHVTRWKHDENAVHWIRIPRAQDQGLELWQTKTFAIMTHATTPGDCIDRVTSQDGDRVLFERLGTPIRAPKVTLKRNWQSQQQQPTSDTDVPSFWKQETKREDEAGVQDGSDHSTEVDLAHWKMRHTTSNMDVDTHLGGREVNPDVFPDDGAKNQIIERIKIGSNKICMREDLAKEKMVFSQESSHAIIEMGNVELIEFKTSRIQCP